MPKREPAPRNRTITLSDDERPGLRRALDRLGQESQNDRLINGDAFEVLPTLPAESFDLLFADPPYNLTKQFGSEKFRETSDEDYEAWLDSWLSLCVPLLKPQAFISVAIGEVLRRYSGPVRGISSSATVSLGNGKRAAGPRRTGRTPPRTSGSSPSRTNSHSTSML